MCYKIDAEVVIANYFAECENETELKFSTLAEIKEEIENEFKKMGKFLFVDNSRRSVMNAVFSNPGYFSFDPSGFSINFNNFRMNLFYEDVYSIFNSKIDPRIKYTFLSKLENVLEKYSLPVDKL